MCGKIKEEGSSNWGQVQNSFKREVKQWVKKTKTPDVMLKEIEEKMKDLNAQPPDQVLTSVENELQVQHRQCLALQEHYWYQRSRIQWALFGDNNTSFFHASAVTRKRRNTVKAIKNSAGEWKTDDKTIRRTFVEHYRQIYKKCNRTNVLLIYEQEMFAGLPQIPSTVHMCLIADPTDMEIHRALMTLGPDKAAGPDGFNARIIQTHWEVFRPAVLKEVKAFFQTGKLHSKIAR